VARTSIRPMVTWMVASGWAAAALGAGGAGSRYGLTSGLAVMGAGPLGSGLLAGAGSGTGGAGSRSGRRSPPARSAGTVTVVSAPSARLGRGATGEIRGADPSRTRAGSNVGCPPRARAPADGSAGLSPSAAGGPTVGRSRLACCGACSAGGGDGAGARTGPWPWRGAKAGEEWPAGGSRAVLAGTGASGMGAVPAGRLSGAAAAAPGLAVLASGLPAGRSPGASDGHPGPRRLAGLGAGASTSPSISTGAGSPSSPGRSKTGLVTVPPGGSSGSKIEPSRGCSSPLGLRFLATKLLR